MVKIDHLKATYDVEVALWNSASSKLDESNGEDQDALNILRTIDSYNSLIHEELVRKFGENYADNYKD